MKLMTLVNHLFSPLCASYCQCVSIMIKYDWLCEKICQKKIRYSQECLMCTQNAIPLFQTLQFYE